MTVKYALFDLDGTLTAPRGAATPEMLELIQKLRTVAKVGVVSGSDLPKLNEQFTADCRDCVDYTFPENGIIAYEGKEMIGSHSFAEFLGEEKLQEMINFVLRYFSEITLPVKRGTFVEYRMGMLNFSPVGRQCSQEERIQFNEYDKQHGIRQKFVEEMDKQFSKYGVQFAIGGQISVDCFPKGWDKTFVLRYLPEDAEIHFFGDKTTLGGNDYEIYEHPRTIGHSVKDPKDAMRQIKEIFGI
ncbi:phosphomannomutase, putative [Perkinsus marinus ATCC 50983]|uniref:Phosphomannomutase n=2 Tax=Perkinsus marinus (strain ATCC 50983 / TXsc) TaxID=423536 RepID=C5KD23_PERM5|nr:phosphomannomutase, putative [Perkinsus marinus ATCC 50983]EER17772.1 phosphomannomutase, putative [Perkinsus marinus ATCC 50983]|eukprot:XP_002785976.1 phosphomannomutase, putative [Perkinsus marinus ATCC 50983]